MANKIPYAELRRTIGAFMRSADLSRMSTKKIRLQCEKKFKMNLASRKHDIDQIIMSYMEEGGSSSEDESGNEGNNCDRSRSSKSQSSCSSSNCSDSDGSPVLVNSANPNKKLAVATPPKKRILEEKKLAAQVYEAPASKVMQSRIPVPPKKRPIKMPAKKTEPSPVRTEQPSIHDDEELARRLQAEEWNFRQRTVKRAIRPRGAAKKVDQNGEPKKRKPGAYARNCMLSDILTQVLKTNQMPRFDVVRSMWDIVRERGLFDPSNRRYAFCDEQLFKVFGRPRIRLFGMMKYLKHHIKDII